jgi:hypothetical protein
MPTTFTLTKKRVRTYAPSAGNTVTLWDRDDADIATSENRIGEKKLLQLDFTMSDPFIGGGFSVALKKFYIVPALFVNNGFINPLTNQGNNYWSVQIPNSAAAATYNCAYVGTGPYPNQGKNFHVFENDVVQLEVVDATHIKIFIPYYQTYDAGGFLDPVGDDNAARFLKDSPTNPNELTVSGSTVFNDPNVDGRVYIYAVDPANFYPGSTEVILGGYKAGFYGKNAHETAPYFTNPSWVFKYLGGTVTEPKTIGQTDVEFFIDSATAPTGLFMWMIREDNINANFDFVTSYEADFQNISAGNAGGAKIIGPMVDFALVAGTTYKATFKVDPSTLVIHAKYRFIAVVYDDSAFPVMNVNSFISSQVRPNADVPWNGDGIEFKGRLCDVQNEFVGDELTCVIEERMKSKLRMNYFYDKFKNDVFNRLGLVIVNDIRKYLKRIEFTIYEEYTSLGNTYKHILDQRAKYRVVPNVYGGHAGIDLQFNTDYAEFAAEWRNRFESGLQNIQTYINGIAASPLSNQYWGGRDLFVEWKLIFTYDDYVSPFSDVLYYKQKLHVKDYQPEHVHISAQNEPDEDKEFWCPNDFMCLKASLPLRDDNMVLITNFDKDPGTESSIVEAEAWVPDELSQDTTPRVYNEEINYGQTDAYAAKFCIKVSDLTVNLNYKVSAIAKKYYPRYRLITEDGAALLKTEFVEQITEERNKN